MITALAIRSFQSIQDAELEIAPFTVIVGRTGSGKSALMRAVRAVVQNKSGGDFVTWGKAAESIVFVETDDHSVLWRKPQEGGATYIVDELELTKTGRSVPAEVEEALGMRKIEIDPAFSITPQIHGQFDGQFLLGETPGRVAKSLAKLTRLDAILQAESLASRDLKKAKAEIKHLDPLITKGEETVLELTTTHELAWKFAIQVSGEADLLRSSVADYEQGSEVLARLKELAEAKDVNPPTRYEFAAVKESFDKFEAGTRLVRQLKVNTARLGSLHEDEESARLRAESARKELAKVTVCPVCGSRLEKGLADHGD